MLQSPHKLSNNDKLLNLVSLEDYYDIVRELGRGTYGRVDLAVHRESGLQLALKSLCKKSTKFKDFQRECTLGDFLSVHPNVINSYDVAFETPTAYVFAQEYTAYGDLFEAIPPQHGLSESVAKQCMQQIASAIDFIHTKGFVHRDIKPENVLLFSPDCSIVKLMDFGMTRRSGTHVRKISGSIPYTPPEICQAVKNEGFYVESSQDVWAFGVLLFSILTGNFPWEAANTADAYFLEFIHWQRRKTPAIPTQWRRFTPRLMKCFRKILDIRPDKRCAIREIYKYLGDDWIKRENEPLLHSETFRRYSKSMDELSVLLEAHGVNTSSDAKGRERMTSEWVLTTTETFNKRSADNIVAVGTPPEYRHQYRPALAELEDTRDHQNANTDMTANEGHKFARKILAKLKRSKEILSTS
ncbi:serine/threonine-protein kinase SBK1-like [Saccoglossus kowalevskii]|uniref:Serine/threonine-protein kinase SBK1-like n=1 Tax=Saccoglossus kowalevskii TaxID=10224 RepID=A0ABM0GWV6_SACKO|nr:PREDICTED: serine/threonine-protein kinase SBK1-like [Saccoglossus kowalevskii]